VRCSVVARRVRPHGTTSKGRQLRHDDMGRFHWMSTWLQMRSREPLKRWKEVFIIVLMMKIRFFHEERSAMQRFSDSRQLVVTTIFEVDRLDAIPAERRRQEPLKLGKEVHFTDLFDGRSCLPFRELCNAKIFGFSPTSKTL